MTPAELSRTVMATVRRAVDADELRVAVPERIVVQRPPRPGCGDYATNVALQLAAAAGRTPVEVAQILGRRLAEEPGIAQVEVAEPGFLNITLHAHAYGDVVRQVRAEGERYGYGDGLADEPLTATAAPGDHRGALTAEVVNRLARAGGAPLAAAPEVLTPAPAPDAPPAALGPDEIRWALLRPPAEDTPRLTPGLLVQREANPLFRVRYAHARTRALLRNARDLGVDPDAHSLGGPDDLRDPPGDDCPFHLHPAETELLGLIADFPRVIETAARRRAPDRVARHMERLADAFLRFHDECPPLPRGDEKPSAIHSARARMTDAAGIVLAGGLRLLGITAPDHL